MLLGLDCTYANGLRDHRNATVGFGKDLQTKDVARFAPGLVKEWARIFRAFLEARTNAYGKKEACKRDVCVHGADEAQSQAQGTIPAAVKRRVLEGVQRSSIADLFQQFLWEETVLRLENRRGGSCSHGRTCSWGAEGE